jgi:cytochrome P450
MATQTLPAVQGGLLGLGSLLRFRNQPLTVLEEAARLGDLSNIPFGPRALLLVSHPDLVHEVLVEKAGSFYKTRQLKKIFAASLGQGLLTSDGDYWRRQRKLVQPAFHHKRIEAYAQTMVEYAERMMQDWAAGEAREVDHDMMKLTLGIVSKTLFNADTSAEADKLGEAITVGQEITIKQFNAIFTPPAWLPTRENKLAEWSLNTINETVMGFIQERRKTGEDKGDLLSMLLLSRDEDGSGGMTDKQARDESFTLFVAGHETTANALTWTWWLLSQSPDKRATLHRELDTVLAGRPPTAQDLAKLPYLDQVIKESMRIRPPVWITSREPIEDVKIGGHLVKKGGFVGVSPWTMHHDARFYDAPQEFRPERWTPAFEKQLPKFAYFPFGGGPRVCIGNQFALMEAKLVLATVAQRWTLDYAGAGDPGLSPLITLRPKHGMPMRITPRKTDFNANTQSGDEAVVSA